MIFEDLNWWFFPVSFSFKLDFHIRTSLASASSQPHAICNVTSDDVPASCWKMPLLAEHGNWLWLWNSYPEMQIPFHLIRGWFYPLIPLLFFWLLLSAQNMQKIYIKFIPERSVNYIVAHKWMFGTFTCTCILILSPQLAASNCMHVYLSGWQMIVLISSCNSQLLCSDTIFKFPLHVNDWGFVHLGSSVLWNFSYMGHYLHKLCLFYVISFLGHNSGCHTNYFGPAL